MSDEHYNEVTWHFNPTLFAPRCNAFGWGTKLKIRVLSLAIFPN